MGKSRPTMVQEIAEAVMTYQQQTTGHTPKAITVVLSQDTLVVTLHEALSPAEKDLAKSSSGAAQVREFHRQLFSTSSQRLQKEIERITRVEWREAVAEVEPTAGPWCKPLREAPSYRSSASPTACPGTALAGPGIHDAGASRVKVVIEKKNRS